MPNLDIIIPADISKLIDEREKVWEDYDKAEARSKEINQLASRLGTEIPASITAKFSAIYA